MISDRGHHHTVETEILSLTDDAAGTPIDEPTTVWWWARTIGGYVLLAVAVGVLAALVVVPRSTGSTAYTVLTGSMQPEYPPGTLIVVKPIAGDQLRAGDVITFQPESGNPAVVTHRITSIVYDAEGVRRFVTKGDANSVQDSTLLVEEQIRGKLFYSLPYMGRLNSLLSGSTRGALVMIVGGGLALYALWLWGSGLRDRRKHSSDRDDSDDLGQAPEVDEHPNPAAVMDSRPPVPPPPRCHHCGAVTPTRSDTTITQPIPIVR